MPSVAGLSRYFRNVQSNTVSRVAGAPHSKPDFFRTAMRAPRTALLDRTCGDPPPSDV